MHVFCDFGALFRQVNERLNKCAKVLHYTDRGFVAALRLDGGTSSERRSNSCFSTKGTDARRLQIHHRPAHLEGTPFVDINKTNATNNVS